MKRLIIPLLILTLFSCKEDPNYDVLPNQRPLYNYGDTFYYYSGQTKETEAFVVSSVVYQYDIDDERYCFKESTFDKVGDTAVRVSIRPPYSDDCLLVAVCESSWVSDAQKDTININNTDYTVVKTFLYYEDDSVTGPTALYSSVKYGLMGYEYSDNVSYFITNPAKKK